MSNDDDKFRLVTRSDFDGLVCAVLLRELDVINEIKFVHPKDVQDGLVLLDDSDITANLPFDDRVQRAFDHHHSESIRLEEMPANYVNLPAAPSAARVIYDYYGGKEAFPRIDTELMEAVDKGDSAQFTMDEVMSPTNWSMLNFVMDSRTGLGRFKEFRISNYDLMMALIEYCRDHTIEEILDLADVKERIELYMDHKDQFVEQIRRCSTMHDNLVVLDLRNEETIYAGNRFMIYGLYPETNISIHAIWGLNKLNTVFAVGKSIFNKTSRTNIGELVLKYGGGGHEAAGTCQVDNDDSERILNELTAQITTDG
ncbi:MAG: exopolyphosphatase [Rhodospirillaceae bacterium]|jgi:nanoRNase/pAp phosphatase (c-di-AMP/oligoRNAs hydrolase)|nr:exopolyphosphatase [Rhodospirillaceae bacterium]MBT4589199.1 exopolyphosphatase [Rhodospirillaceae bacterium]MBT5941762.1 exopolyphosphatase [Rhodospirillaceae bacterium]MBT7267672.1 exopolyphosphatase [Rhodospirillaceae bacterium]